MKEGLDFWMKDVELGQFRGRIIGALFVLMDGKYQEVKWIYASEAGKQESFDAEIYFSVELFDDLSMFDKVSEGTIPYNKVGVYLKTKKEAEYLYEVTKPLDYLADNCYHNVDYLSSSQLYELREISLEAFIIFMENEKENEEFCKFIAELIRKERWPEVPLDGQDPYKLIMEYVEICRKNNQTLKKASQAREQ